MYIVKKNFGRTETQLQQFKVRQAAEDFIQEKLKEDKHFKITATYRLYDWDDLIREFSQSDLPTESTSSGDAGQQGGGGKKSSFSPTPFNTAPRPVGMPISGLKDEDDKKSRE